MRTKAKKKTNEMKIYFAEKKSRIMHYTCNCANPERLFVRQEHDFAVNTRVSEA